MRRCGFLLLSVPVLLLPLARPAHAELKLCNRTSYVLYAATATVANQDAQAAGWTRVAPGDCQTALKPPLTQNTLVYARSSLAHSGPSRAWGGDFPLCVHDANFALRQPANAPNCATGTGFSVPFAPVDNHGQKNWTMNFDEQPAYASLTAAQLAGVKRLLADNGFAIGAINAAPDKPTGKAIMDFRKKMRFADTAGNADLFAALETEAMKTNAPAGYTVCNDGNDELLVAMGETPARAPPVSRGWWRIAAGACAHTITAPLAADAVYLLAQKVGGALVAGGNDRFCIVALEFDVQGRGGCATRGMSEAGFARTVTRGQSGYVAHIGGNGLMASLARHSGISK